MALVRRVRAGDTEAFGDLYDRHRADVLRYLQVRTQDHALAEDLCSETFLRAFKGFDGFGGGNFGAWLTRIARNLMFDHHKSSRAKSEVLVRELFGATEVAPGPETLVIEQYDERRGAARVRDGLTSLTADQRTCLTLRFFREHSVADTALVMGRSEGAVRVLQHRAVRMLGQALAPALAVDRSAS